MNLDNKNSAGIIELIDKGAKIVTSPRKLKTIIKGKKLLKNKQEHKTSK